MPTNRRRRCFETGNCPQENNVGMAISSGVKPVFKLPFGSWLRWPSRSANGYLFPLRDSLQALLKISKLIGFFPQRLDASSYPIVVVEKKVIHLDGGDFFADLLKAWRRRSTISVLPAAVGPASVRRMGMPLGRRAF